MAWTFWTSATLLFSAQLVFAFVELCGATWDAQPYQTFLLYVAFAFYALVVNTKGFKVMPFLSKFVSQTFPYDCRFRYHCPTIDL